MLLQIAPDIIADQGKTIQLILWIGGIMVTAMATTITVLWKAKENRDSYIREQDKANQAILMEIANNYKVMGVDLSKLEATTSNELKPNVKETRNIVGQIIKKCDQNKIGT